MIKALNFIIMAISRFITEKTIKTVTNIAQKDAKEGWQVNPNPKVVEGIFKGLIRCSGQCPCSNNSQEKECPCSGYRNEDKCCCNLYVKV